MVRVSKNIWVGGGGWGVECRGAFGKHVSNKKYVEVTKTRTNFILTTELS